MKRAGQWFLLLNVICAGPAFAEQLCHDALVATAPDHYYRYDKAGTVVDVRQQLMWQRCALGQQWKNQQCVGEAQTISLDEAADKAKQIEAAGYDNWRLPTIQELSTLTELRCYQPAINLAVFPNTPAADFWTSTDFVNNSGLVWLVHFQYGENHTAKKTYTAAVRLVRNVTR